MAKRDEYSGPRATKLINVWASGDQAAADDVFRILEAELRSIARRAMSRDDRMQGLIEPADLFSQLFLKLDQQFKNNGGQFEKTERFLGLVHQVMRHFLLDQGKQGGASAPRRRDLLSISWVDRTGTTQEIVHTSDLFDALDQLTARSPELGHAMRQHYLEGKTLNELAAAMGKSTATVKLRLKAGKEWMRKRLRPMAPAQGTSRVSRTSRVKKR